MPFLFLGRRELPLFLESSCTKRRISLYRYSVHHGTLHANSQQSETHGGLSCQVPFIYVAFYTTGKQIQKHSGTIANVKKKKKILSHHFSSFEFYYLLEPVSVSLFDIQKNTIGEL